MRLELHELHYNLGWVLHQGEDLSGAAQSYRQAIALNPQFMPAHHNLAVVLDAQGRLEEAIAHYQTVIAHQPDQVSVLSNLGCALIKQGNFLEAIAIFEQALFLTPDDPTVYQNLGQAKLANGEGSGAIVAYRRATALAPHSVTAWYGLGRSLQHQGYHTAAIAAFEQVILQDPSHEAMSDLAASWLALGRWEEAIVCLQRAIEPQCEFVNAYCDPISEPDEFDELSRAQAACRRLIDAIQTNAAEAKGYLAETYIYIGNVLTQYGGKSQDEQATTFYQKALQLQPENFDLYLQLGKSLVRQRRIDAAILVYHLALTIQPDRPEVHFQLGYALEKQQQWEEAIACYQKVLQQGLGIGDWGLGIGDWGVWGVGNGTKCDILVGGCRSTREWMVAANLADHYVALSKEENPRFGDEWIGANSRQNFCHGINCVPCLQRIVRWFEPIHLGRSLHQCSMNLALPECSPPRFVATIPQGRVWVAPQHNSWMICNAIAVLTPDHFLLADVSRDYPGRLPGCDRFKPTQHRIFEQETLPPMEVINGTVAVLAGLSGHVYFHWLIDILPRFELLRLSGIDFDQIDWFLVNSDRQPFQQATLEQLGIPKSKILQSDRHPHLQASQLIVPSFPGDLGWAEGWAIDFLRRSFLEPQQAEFTAQSLPEKIYISRSDARYRQVLNETEVVEELRKFGIVPVELRSLSFTQQVALFANAKLIIAPHGSGLTNLVFCRPGTKVIELVSPHYIRHYFWKISHYLQLEHYFLVGETFTCYPLRQLMYLNSLTEDILISLASLQRVMQRVEFTA